MKKIKPVKNKKKSKISTGTPPVNYEENPPIFSLERLQKGNYCLQELDQEGKACFADAIFRRKSTTWKEIKKAPRHGIGFEKISINSIKAPIPAFITEEEDNLLAFRFHGKKPMVGYRKNDIFYVLWFDKNFTLYPH